ncbi:MAG: Rid family detoxifying hydrolase [Candidatus Bipolaricaulaceae bacterium]
MTGRPVLPVGVRTAGPYSPGVAAGGFVFVSGQIPVDEAGELVRGGIEGQLRRCLENVRAVLAAAGADLADLVQVTIFLVDMGDYPEVNRVYAQYFDLAPPARVCVQVAALPQGARIEVAGVAYRPD